MASRYLVVEKGYYLTEHKPTQVQRSRDDKENSLTKLRRSRPRFDKSTEFGVLFNKTEETHAHTHKSTTDVRL